MSIPDYYKILEVQVTASALEIKSAYRRLAKIYHPDKNKDNPGADEKFRLVKEAYDILINPLKRSKYDSQRNHSFSSQRNAGGQKSGAKNYNYVEKEIKYRQYYQQHYKKASGTVKVPPQGGKNNPYKDNRSILLSVPLAVALLLFIIRIYQPKKAENMPGVNPVNRQTSARSDIKTSQSPYLTSLGHNRFDTLISSVIRIKNRSGYDALVFLKDGSGTVRHHFIEKDFELYMENVPASSYHFYYWLGENFSDRNYLFGIIIGGFKKTRCVDSLDKNIVIEKENPDTVMVELKMKENFRDSSLLKKIFAVSDQGLIQKSRLR